MRDREIAVQSMAQQTAQVRLERAMSSKACLASEQLELQPGNLVDFWRRPATKDESGWRGLATVTVAPGPRVTVRWQGRSCDVRVQDLSHSLVFLRFLTRVVVDSSESDPMQLLISFAESLNQQAVGMGWVREDSTAP